MYRDVVEILIAVNNVAADHGSELSDTDPQFFSGFSFRVLRFGSRWRHGYKLILDARDETPNRENTYLRLGIA